MNPSHNASTAAHAYLDQVKYKHFTKKPNKSRVNPHHSSIINDGLQMVTSWKNLHKKLQIVITTKQQTPASQKTHQWHQSPIITSLSSQNYFLQRENLHHCENEETIEYTTM